VMARADAAIVISTPYNRRMGQRSWLHNHALSLVIATVLLIWIALYMGSDRTTHLGAFYGNAAADWLGSLVTVLGTKFFYETGSAESRVPPILRRHTPLASPAFAQRRAGGNVGRVDLVVCGNRTGRQNR
jgi:hypothetical protein